MNMGEGRDVEISFPFTAFALKMAGGACRRASKPPALHCRVLFEIHKGFHLPTQSRA